MTIKRLVKTAFLLIFVSLVVLASARNCVHTERVTIRVEEFFIRTRAITQAQAAADRAMAIVEANSYAFNDLRENYRNLHTSYQRLTFKAQDAMMEATNFEKVIHAQNAYIVQLQTLLQDNNIPPPVQPRIKLEPQAWPNPSAGNSFNSQRPTNPMLPVPRLSPGGSSPRNSTEPDASGNHHHEA